MNLLMAEADLLPATKSDDAPLLDASLFYYGTT